jgi:O-antigen ligase
VRSEPTAGVPVTGGVRILQVIALTLMIFPSDRVFKPIGAGGSPAGIVALFAFVAWAGSTLFGINNPRAERNPMRAAVAGMWIVTLVSYAIMHLHPRPSDQMLSADRWLMQLAGLSAIVLTCVDHVRTHEQLRQVVRALVWGGAFCGAVATLQFWMHADLTSWLHLPGFHLNSTAYATVSTRDGLNRVSGTAIQAIELGVTASMILPLAIWLAIYDRARSRLLRSIPVVLIAAAIPVSVSRSSVIAIMLAMSTLLVLMPSVQRVHGLALAPVAIAGVFMTAHGFLGTIFREFLLGTKDPSIAHRVNNYPFVEQLVHQAPLFGRGAGTYLPVDNTHILDNQYLTSLIEIGLVGTVALAYYLLLPFFVALVARWRTTDPEIRMLGAALAGAALAATVCSSVFDSFSFPMFAYTEAFVAGIAGSCYSIASRGGYHDVPSQSVQEPSTIGVS